MSRFLYYILQWQLQWIDVLLFVMNYPENTHSDQKKLSNQIRVCIYFLVALCISKITISSFKLFSSLKTQFGTFSYSVLYEYYILYNKWITGNTKNMKPVVKIVMIKKRLTPKHIKKKQSIETLTSLPECTKVNSLKL